MQIRAWHLSMGLILLGSCATPPAPPPAEPVPQTLPPPSQSAPGMNAGSTATNKQLPPGKPGSLLSRVDRTRLTAQIRETPRPINIRHRCAFRDETGYNGSTQVEIANSEVRVLNTQINIPDHGSCNFDWNGFQQTKRSPSIELRHPADGCTVRIWEQGRQLTISYSQCARRCASAETFKYVWPVLIDSVNGACD
ncbi:MAG: hypothetical protein H6R19_665 [Proteobacteria bacterium]|nr:hypothetical protein [Pseudomonadota bacterium]